MSPKTSVLIPAHNAEATIVRAVRSAMDQSLPPAEVIVACDACTDRTQALAEQEGATVVSLEARNGSSARNVAARTSSGEVFLFLDADDWWHRSKIEAHIAVWSSASPSFVIDRSTPVHTNGTTAYWRGGLDREGSAEWFEFLPHKAWASGSSFSVTRKGFEHIGGFNEGLIKFQDVDFLVRCAQKNGPASCLKDSYTNYQLSDRASVSKGTQSIEENLNALFAGWPFASQRQKDDFASHAYLTAAEVTPWPASLKFFRKAKWPVSQRFFWKSLYQSMSAKGGA